jgi:hypothetical protein
MQKFWLYVLMSTSELLDVKNVEKNVEKMSKNADKAEFISSHPDSTSQGLGVRY